jgi:hypothetical protein
MQRPKPKARVSIADNPEVLETFATSVVDVSLIGSGSISVTFGTLRNIRDSFEAEPERTVCVTNRVVLTIDAAQSLAHLLSRILARARDVSEQRAGEPGSSKLPRKRDERLS